MNDVVELKISSHPSGRLTLERKEPGHKAYIQVDDDLLFGSLEHDRFWKAVALYMGNLANTEQPFRIQF